MGAGLAGESMKTAHRRGILGQVARRAAGLTGLIFFAGMLFAGMRAAAQAAFTVDSSSFTNGGAMPQRLTCDGSNLSPQLRWMAGPTGTKTFALVMDDPDAPVDFTHWIAFDLPASARQLAEGASRHAAMPAGSAEGVNSFGGAGYGGPCPPPGKPHHYIFRLYALDIRLALPPGAEKKRVEAAIAGHVLAQGRIVGIYQRAGR